MKESMEEKYEVAQRRMADYWEQVNTEPSEHDDQEPPTVRPRLHWLINVIQDSQFVAVAHLRRKE